MSPQAQQQTIETMMMMVEDEATINTMEQEPKQHRRRRFNRKHRGAYREVTLIPGSPFHEAFFGSDENLRVDFRCEDHVAGFCNNRDLTRSTLNGNGNESSRSLSVSSRKFLRERQDSDLSMMSVDSVASTSSAGAYKAGRPMLPRYAEF